MDDEQRQYVEMIEIEQRSYGVQWDIGLMLIIVRQLDRLADILLGKND